MIFLRRLEKRRFGISRIAQKVGIMGMRSRSITTSSREVMIDQAPARTPLRGGENRVPVEPGELSANSEPARSSIPCTRSCSLPI